MENPNHFVFNIFSTQLNPVAFNLFGIEVKWYGILIALGFLLAIHLCYKRAPMYKINQESILDFSLWLIPASIIGARLYYVAFRFDLYKDDLWSVFNIRAGGMAIHGGIIAGLLVGLAFCKYHKINPLDLGDLIAPPLALAQAIGRWGNFFNGEAHGGPTNLPWAISVDGQMVHPTFLYESTWCLALFFLLSHLGKNRRFNGQIMLLYGILYSAERFLVEGLRTDSLMFLGLKQAQIISLGTIIICILLYVFLNKAHQKSLSSKKTTSKKRHK